MTQVSIGPRGQTFSRTMILRALSKNAEFETAFAIAQNRWGSHIGSTIAKAAVAPVMTAEMGDDAIVEFFNLVMERSLLGRLAGLRRVPFNTKMLRIASGAGGYWVSEGNPIPLSKPVLAGSALPPLKVAAIIVASDESLRSGGSIAENAFQRDLERAVIDTLDIALLDPANAGVTDERPASLTHDAPEVTATGDAAADVASLIAAFGGDLGSAFFVTDAQTATAMALLRSEGAPVFPDVGARGGSVLGIPLLVSRASPTGQLALIDPTGIAYATDGISFENAEHATLTMSDDPAGDDPAEVETLNLWQNNLTGFKSTLSANWEIQRDGGVAVLTGVNWGA